MRLIQLRLYRFLFITTIIYTTEGITGGCEDWKLHGDDEVCCQRCSPGHHLVARCGRDRTKLCTPCEANKYTHDSLAWFCKTCTQCIAPLVQLKPCSPSADTVCGCKPGFRCGNERCDYCVTECTKGQEPAADRTCNKCPEGTFNDEIHSYCKPWSKRCPEGQHIVERGTEFSDIKCSRIPETTTSTRKEITTKGTTERTTERTKTDDGSIYPLIGIFGCSSGLMIILILLLWLTYKRTKNKSKSKEPKPDTPAQGELTIMMVEHEEACSFHQPEQEQGGSCESIDTQDSETKLIV